MATLTTNQQQLIDQIITEFIQYNEVSEVKKTKSLLGVDEIIDSVKRKNAEILRTKEHNRAVFKALEPIFDENYKALSQDIDALGLDLRITSGWWETSSGVRGASLKISMYHNQNSDHDLYFDAKITGECLMWEGEPIWSIAMLQPTLLYSYRSKDYTFEQLCKNPEFVARIKNMYEKKTK